MFHYVPLHSSPKGRELVGDLYLPVTEDLSGRLIRMPFFYAMTADEQFRVIESLTSAVLQLSSSAVLH